MYLCTVGDVLTVCFFACMICVNVCKLSMYAMYVCSVRTICMYARCKCMSTMFAMLCYVVRKHAFCVCAMHVCYVRM